MPLRRLILVLAVGSLVITSACKPKKSTAPPPQAQAPTMTTLPAVIQPVPEVQPPKTEDKPAETATATPPPPPKAKPSRPRARKETPADTPSTVASNRPPTPTPRPTPPPRQEPAMVVPALPHDQALHDRMTTEVLMQSTEQNLSGMPRGLNSDQQGIVQQIRVYMAQSRGALQDGDPTRARVLAMKAHLLSDELAKH